VTTITAGRGEGPVQRADPGACRALLSHDAPPAARRLAIPPSVCRADGTAGISGR